MIFFKRLDLRRLTSVVGFLCFLILTCQGFAQLKTIDEFKDDKDCINYLEKLFPGVVKNRDIAGLAVAVIKDGKILWEGAYGYLNLKSSKKVNSSSLFDAASMSKPVTAFLTLKMMESGEIDIDKPLSEYLSHQPINSIMKSITPRMVLTHTTGLPNWGEQLIYKPGEQFSYSGQGFVYLSQAIENIKGKPFHQVMDEEVLTPFKMNHSTFLWEKEKADNWAYGHTDEGEIKNIKQYLKAHGAGTLATTAGDYARFIIALLNKKGLKKTTYQQMLSRQVKADDWGGPHRVKNISWGLGWGIQAGEAEDLFFHMGNNRYWRGYILADSKTKNGIVYFSNCESGNEIAKDIVGLISKGKQWGLQLVE